MNNMAELHKEAPGPFFRPYWGEPRYLNDGDTVWLPASTDFDSGKTRALRCTVTCAAGNHARIRDSLGRERWARLASLLVPPDDPRHWNQASR
jgi:hypothetical protein